MIICTARDSWSATPSVEGEYTADAVLGEVAGQVVKNMTVLGANYDYTIIISFCKVL